MSTILRRKIAATQPPSQVANGAAHLLPLALARTARTGFGLDVDCGAAVLRNLSLAELLELPDERALILLLEGPCGGGGMVALCPAMLASLIEVQTLGRVSGQPVVSRRPTRTDAAMVAEWVDALLVDLEGALASHDDLVWADGFRVSGHLEDTRPLALMLEEMPYHALDLGCDLSGARQGRLVLALPAEGRGRRPHAVAASATERSAPDATFAPLLAARVMEARAELWASLLRLRLPLGELNTLRPGQVLPLPAAALDRIELLGIDGVPRGSGRLGQQGGQRAVRITHCDDARGAGPDSRAADPSGALPALAAAS